MFNRITGTIQPLREGNKQKAPGCKSGRFGQRLKWALPISAIAAAIAAAAATATAATVAATPAATVTAASSTAWGSRFTWTRFVHGQCTAFHCFAIKLGNGILCFLFCRHRHKSEAARLACEFILHKHDILHSTSLCEEILKVGFCRIERKISNV
jgi:hypothetical protein